MIRQFLIGGFSALLCMLSVWLVYVYLENAPGIVMLLWITAVGFFAGIAQGLLFGAASSIAVGIGALLGILLLSTPVILVTYGMGMLGLPGLAIFGWLAGLGAKLGGRRIATRRTPQA